MTQDNDKHKKDSFGGQDGNLSPAQIRAKHQKKLAIIYVRQTVPGTGSIESQRSLAELPRRWGWPGSLITTIDDLGFPGTPSVDRPGFLRLKELMERGKVGIVLVRDLTRLARDSASLERFMTDAVRHGVLVYVDGHIYGPGAF